MAIISKIKLIDGTTYDIKDTTYENATTSASGLMSSADKIKLDGIPAVTSSDNGKVLRVVDGAWAAVSLPSASGVSF